jgi:alkanesulfonate monooxygenase SsuD/methylene tetrahydromethanopterin reductase-like flavin-dependent oxidoreductase (luciferase family)
VGTSVALTPLRHPVDAALQARSLALMSGHPYVAGYGVSEPGTVTALRGAPYASPRTAAADYMRAMRGLLDGHEVALDSAYSPTHLRLPPLAHPPVELALGVLRPGMAQTAGAVADAAITWLTPPRYIEEQLVPALDRGAAQEGRARPRIVSVVHAGLARPGQDPAAMLAAAADAHLRTEHYTDMLRKAGIDADPRRPDATARELVRAGAYALGSPEEVVAALASYASAGVAEVVLNPLAMMLARGVDGALEDLRVLLDALRQPAAR